MQPTHSLAETAQLLSVTPTWLASRARQGRVPAHRLGRRWIFTDEDIARILEASATGKTAINPWGLTPRSTGRRHIT